MINGIQGKPGGGKSYEAVVNHIIPVITKDKRKVVTNLPLNVEHFCNVFGEYCRDLIEVVDGQFHNYGGERPFSKKEHYLQYEDWQNEEGQKVYFFVDECHLAMATGSTDKELKEFFSMHRHYGFDIMLITQNFRKVDRDVKDMVQTGYRAIKKSFAGQDDKYILKVHDGATQSNASCIATHERFYDKKYFPFYQSHTKSDKSITEATSKDIQIWWKHWTIKASIGFFIFGFFIIGSKLSGSNESDSKQISPKVPVASDISAVKDLNLNQPNVKSLKSQPRFEKPKLNERQEEYMKMVEKSKAFHPYYKVNLSISGNYSDPAVNQVSVYFSASQNGQQVFTLELKDLMLAGYEISVLTECAVRIRYFDYEDFITCDAPRQSVKVANHDIKDVPTI